MALDKTNKIVIGILVVLAITLVLVLPWKCSAQTAGALTPNFPYSAGVDKAMIKQHGIDWQNTYAIDWQESQQKGDVYLRTIVYTNPEADTVMQAVHPQGRVSLITPDQEGGNVALNGISSMQFNSFSGGSSGKITSVSQVFDLVKDGGICVLSNGSTASFYWNPQTIYTQDGEQGNIHDITQGLKAGSTCIGRS